MENFQERLADAETTAYGWKRGGEEGDRTVRGDCRKGENESRERWRRKEGEGVERDRRRGNERERELSATDRERESYTGRREERERGEHRGRGKERVRDGDRCGEGDNKRERNRDKERSRETERRREGERPSAASSFDSHRSSSLGSLKSRFLKPSEDDNCEGELMSNHFFILYIHFI